MANRYWVGGAGAWDGTSTTHWSATSGGAGGASVPTSADDVIFDGNSGTGNVTIASSPRVARSLDFTGYTGTFTMSSGITVNIGDASGGALTLSATMTLTVAGGTFGFVSSSTNGGAGWGITTAGKTLPSINFNNAGGRWKLLDPLTLPASTGSFTITAGYVDTNNQPISCGAVSIASNNQAKTLAAGTSTFTLNATSGTIWNVPAGATNTVISAGSATIIATTTGAGVAFTLGNNVNYVYGTLQATAGMTQWTISAGANTTIGTVNYTGPAGNTGILIFSATTTVGTLTVGTSTMKIQFLAGSTFTVTTWNVSGSASNTVQLRSSASGTAYTLKRGDASVASSDYLSIQDSTAQDSAGGSGTGKWYAGTHSTDVSGNTGWTFTAPPATGAKPWVGSGASRPWHGAGAEPWVGAA